MTIHDATLVEETTMEHGVLWSHMATEQQPRSQCLTCGFQAESGGDEWLSVDVPKLGQLTQCPECESTDIVTGVSIR